EEAAQEWHANAENSDLLWRGLRLSNAEAWIGRAQPRLNVRDQSFLDSSRAAEQTRKDAEEAARQRELGQAHALAEGPRLRAEEQQRRAEAERQRAEEQSEARQRELAQAHALAEEQRLRAEEQQRRAEAERQRAEEQTAASRRLRRRAIQLRVALVVAAG